MLSRFQFNATPQADRNSFERPLIYVLCMRGPGWFWILIRLDPVI